MWWRVSAARLDQIRQISASGGVVPLICTVSKAFVIGYHVTGIDDMTPWAEAEGRAAFTVADPGPWLDKLAPLCPLAERRAGRFNHLVGQVKTAASLEPFIQIPHVTMPDRQPPVHHDHGDTQHASDLCTDGGQAVDDCP